MITATAGLVARTLPPGSEEAEAMADLLVSSENAATMVRKLLNFSRQGDLMMRVLDLRPVVRDLVPTLSRLLASDHPLAVTIDEPLPAVLADPDAVEQMLLNLITNARDAMADGGEIRVRVHAPTDTGESDDPDAPPAHLLGQEGPPAPGNCVVIEVGDSGTGMTPDVVERILEPFFTTKPTGQGTGLGLSMVYGLMRQHRGFVTLCTAPGWGAVFSLHFPVYEASAGAPRRERRPRAVAGSLPRGTETILLVDDQDETRRTGGRVLRRYGYTVLEAADGVEALAIFRRAPTAVDLVLTDYMMPEMNGLVLIERLHADGHSMKVALSSGHADPQQDQGTPDAVEVPMIAKPWTLEELVTGVREVLDGQR